MNPNGASLAEDLRGENSKAHLGVLAYSLPQWSLAHVWPQSAARKQQKLGLEEQISPSRGSSSLCCPDSGRLGRGGVTIPAQVDSMQAAHLPPQWSPLTKMTAVVQLRGK